jgi:hypothetical protein
MTVDPGLPLDVPDTDAAEALREIRPADEAEWEPRGALPFDADEYDAAEQSIVVETDEDDYR